MHFKFEILAEGNNVHVSSAWLLIIMSIYSSTLLELHSDTLWDCQLLLVAKI